MDEPTLEDALLFIADRCDGANSTDGIGFKKQDAQFGQKMAKKVRSGELLYGQDYVEVYRMLRTYNNKQLAPNNLDIRLIPKERPSNEEKEAEESFKCRGDLAERLEDCPFVIMTEDENGNNKLEPNKEAIATHLIDKFDLMAISNEKQDEGLALWIRSDNDYRQLTKDDTFLIKEMQTAMDVYADGTSRLVGDHWIKRIEILRQLKPKYIVQPTRGMLPLANGILDIKNKRLLTDDEGKICLVRSGVAYDPDAKCPEFDKALEDIFNNNQTKIEALLSWTGAILAGMNPQIVVMLKSRGRSGKGLLMAIITSLLGTMITTMSPNRLHDRFSNWAFLHRRLVYLEEHDGKDATVRAMKELSGGCPSISFETKGVQAIIHAQVQCAIFLVTNNPPPFEKGAAWEERFKMLDFPNSYIDNPEKPWDKSKDTGIEERLKQELSGILNKFLPYAEYALDHPKNMFKCDIPYRDIEEALDKSTDALGNFINACGELAPMQQDCYGNMKIRYAGFTTTDTTFMKRYEEYCSRPDVNVRASAQRFVKEILKRDYNVKIQGHDIHGIRLKKE